MIALPEMHRIGATLMHVRTTVLFTLAGASCMFGKPIGDLPGTSDSGAEGESGTTAGDGNSSQTAEDDGTSETTFDPSEGTTGEVVELCEHEPSGLEPGSVVWEHAFEGFMGHEVAVVNDRPWIIGNSTDTGEADDHTRFARIDADGVGFSSWTWAAPGNVLTNPRLIAAIDDRVFVGINLPGAEHCPWCSERMIIAYDDNNFVPTDPAWELSLGEGAWGMSATPSGTLVVVGSTSDDGVEFEVEITEIDVDGNIIASTPNVLSEEPGPYVVTRVAVGPLGDIIASGGLADQPDGGWTARWTGSHEFNWLLGGSTALGGALARAPNGDYLHAFVNPPMVLERSLAEAGIVWQVEIESEPSDIAVDCDDSIVLAGAGLERRDGDGTVQWTHSLGPAIVAVAIADNGDILALSTHGEASLLERYAGL